MRFPHAAKGITMIFVAEMIALFSIIALAVIILITGASNNALNADNSAGLATGLVLALFGAGAVYFIGFVLKIIGYFQTAREEEGFTRAIIYAVVSIVLFIIANVLSSQKGDVMQWIYTIVLAAAEITQLMIAISTIGEMVDLSYKCGNEGLARRGNTILKIIGAIITLNIILLIINRILVFFVDKVITSTFSTIINVVILVLSVIQYILYLFYLSSVSSMLKES